MRLVNKGFDHKRDYQLIVANSAILYDLFYAKKVMILTPSENLHKYGYYFFDGFNANDMFNYDTTDKGTGIFQRFTF